MVCDMCRCLYFSFVVRVCVPVDAIPLCSCELFEIVNELVPGENGMGSEDTDSVCYHHVCLPISVPVSASPLSDPE